jgi:hypothetical protein
MSGFQCRRNLLRVPERGVERERAMQWSTRDKLHDDGVVLHGVDLGDVRMIQRGKGLGFTLESGQPVRILRNRDRQHFYRDISFEFGIARATNFAHATSPQQGLNLVRANSSAWSQGQGESGGII